MTGSREMTPEERAHVSLRCRVGWHRWTVWLPVGLSRKRLCFGCPKIEYARPSIRTENDHD